MPSTTATNRKISWFLREDNAGSLDLSPSFQRRPVWRPDQSSYLIDTILSALPFPEVYLRSTTSVDGDTSYEVIDGQQRIRAILDFVRNDLVLEGDDVTAKWLGKSFEDLNETQKKVFWAYEVVTRELHDATDGDIRDLFRRLNLSAVTLNDQELRHAKHTGPFIKLMEDIADDEWWTSHGVVNVRQVRRMEDVEYISELFVALMAGPQDKKSTLDSYYEDFNSDFPDAKKWTQHFRRTRVLLEEVLGVEGIKAWNGKSDFYSLFALFGDLAAANKTFNATRRTHLRSALMDFHQKVDQAKRKDNKKKFSPEVHEYAEAVSRAASDIARRKTRHDVLGGLASVALK
jgi:hypothetical protein